MLVAAALVTVVLIRGRVLGEVSELDGLVVGPNEAGDQFQFDKQIHPHTTASARHQHSWNLQA